MIDALVRRKIESQVAVGWAEGRDDTLIIVTADHETGGLRVFQNNGAGTLPTVSWSTKDHTNQQMPIYAWGANASSALQVKDNTDVHSLLMQHIR